MSRTGGVVLTLTPFFPSDQNEVSGCFVAEPLELLRQFGVDSSVIAVSPIYYRRKHPSSWAAAEWVRYPQVPGNIGLSSAGKILYARLVGRVRKLHAVKPIDVIHAHGALPCGHAAGLLSRHLGIPFVVTVHGLDAFNICFRRELSRRGGDKSLLTFIRPPGLSSASAKRCGKFCVTERRLASAALWFTTGRMPNCFRRDR